jgi:hypothetical protein
MVHGPAAALHIPCMAGARGSHPGPWHHLRHIGTSRRGARPSLIGLPEQQRASAEPHFFAGVENHPVRQAVFLPTLGPPAPAPSWG